MKKSFHFNLIFFTALMLISCQSTMIQNLGNPIIETRAVSGFDRVSIVGGGNLTLAQTGTESLSVEAVEPIMEYISTEVRGNTLILEYDPPNNNPTFFLQTINYTLTVNEITGLEISGSGKINAEDITTDSLDLEITGSGDIVVSGSAKKQNIQIDGSGDVEAEDLSGDSGIVSISGSGNVTVWITGSLDIEINGSGTVDYYGDPSTDLAISGSGKINNLGSK